MTKCLYEASLLTINPYNARYKPLFMTNFKRSISCYATNKKILLSA